MLYQLSYVRVGSILAESERATFARAQRRHARRMRRPAVVIGLFLVCCTAACTLRRQVTPPSPYCRGGNPLAGVYHPSRLRVKSRCRVAVGTVSKVVFEPYDGDVHIDLRPGSPTAPALGRQRPRRRQPRRRADPVRPLRAWPSPSEGARVEVVGPWVEDDQHGWNEIHPAWWVSAGRSSPRPPPSCAACSSCSRPRVRPKAEGRLAAAAPLGTRMVRRRAGIITAANERRPGMHELEDTAKALVAEGKGILAADESTGTIKKRFDSIGVESTEDNRRAYRELLFTTAGRRGVHQRRDPLRRDDPPERLGRHAVPEAARVDSGIIPGIKVDTGAKPLALAEDETITEGLDGLRERLAEYRELGARFAKWRATYSIAAEHAERVLRLDERPRARPLRRAVPGGRDRADRRARGAAWTATHTIEQSANATGRALQARLHRAARPARRLSRHAAEAEHGPLRLRGLRPRRRRTRWPRRRSTCFYKPRARPRCRGSSSSPAARPTRTRRRT